MHGALHVMMTIDGSGNVVAKVVVNSVAFHQIGCESVDGNLTMRMVLTVHQLAH